MPETTTVWDIEKEKTWHIYLVFGFLIVLYFVPIFVVWSLVRLLIHARLSLTSGNSPFVVFGEDTLWMLVIAACVSAVHWYYSSKHVVTKVLTLFNARYPDKNDSYHYVFQNVVEEIETAAGGVHVEPYIVPTGALNAFALADLNGRQVIGVTEGLVSRLTRDELQAVVAHEMAHIVSADCLQTTLICSLFGLYSEALANFNKVLVNPEPEPTSPLVQSKADAATWGVLSIPAVVFVFFTSLLAQFLHMFISREKEYRADASAVRLTRNPVALARALYKIGTHWRGAGYGGEYLSPIFILNPECSMRDEHEDFWATLFSTHPPLMKRLNTILNLAHADFAEISRSVSSIKTEPESAREERVFLAKHGETWEGPYSVVQLESFDWLGPEISVRVAGGDDILSATQIPALDEFFRRRDEPISKMRRLCPDCRQWLIVQEYEGLYVWRCAFCNGLLVEEEKLPRIFVRKEKGFSERVQRLAELKRKDAQTKRKGFSLLLDTLHPRKCPKCGKDMRHKFHSYAYHVEIDECLTCKALWFDVDELEILQYLIEMETI